MPYKLKAAQICQIRYYNYYIQQKPSLEGRAAEKADKKYQMKRGLFVSFRHDLLYIYGAIGAYQKGSENIVK